VDEIFDVRTVPGARCPTFGGSREDGDEVWLLPRRENRLLGEAEPGAPASAGELTRASVSAGTGARSRSGSIGRMDSRELLLLVVSDEQHVGAGVISMVIGRSHVFAIASSWAAAA
jgi:hypothetical protein